MRRKIIIGFVVVAIIGVGLYRRSNLPKEPVSNTIDQLRLKDPQPPKLTDKTLIEGLSNVWDLAFTPDNTILFTERVGSISSLKDDKKQLVATIDDVFAQGEGGLMGLAVDPDYNQNQFIYVCFNSKTKTRHDVRVARLKLKGDLSGIAERVDIITGMPINTSGQTGRHSGCRVRFGPIGYLWVGTGDAANGSISQDPTSLGGKILVVDRDGKPAPGNLPAPYDPRIFSYGHRNTQGLAFFSRPRQDGVLGYSVEHGPGKDDEVNVLVQGNFGWNPVPGYNESVPMTDKTKYPEAIEAVWSSGSPTIAPSGAVILEGEQWRAWNGALAVAALKGQHLLILTFDEAGKLKDQQRELKNFGRLRTAHLGPDGDLYLTTDNGKGQDRIIKISPQ